MLKTVKYQNQINVYYQIKNSRINSNLNKFHKLKMMFPDEVNLSCIGQPFVT